MHYALNLRTFLFSHYFYAGLRTAVGVTGMTALVYSLSDITSAVTVGIGALCTSLMDLPSTLRQKFNEMLACALLCAAVALVISLSAPVPWISNAMILAVSFLASMTVAYGKKAMPLQFAALFIMVLSMNTEMTTTRSMLHAVLVLFGGTSYLVYAMCVGWFLRRRIKQQILAEALFELARCIEIKADFYGNNVDLQRQFNLLLTQQSVLAEKQQAARDLLLRPARNVRDNVLLRVHFVMLDMFEAILSTHNDYALIHQYFADHEALTYLRGLIRKAALDVESIAYDITRNKSATLTSTRISYKAEVQAMNFELRGMESDVASGRISGEAFTALSASWVKALALVDLLDHLHAATQASSTPLPLDMQSDMTPFVTQQKYEVHILLSHFKWTSPVLRFAIRMTLAMATCLLVAKHLPYASHAHWLMLTIAVILKPSFSMTRQRRTDRVVGTLIGCILAAITLSYMHEPMALMGVLFAATVAGTAFLQVRYRYTAIAASLRALVLISLLTPDVDQVILERISDTLIGALIATAFSFVLPSWEFRALPKLVGSVLKSAQLYVDASCTLLQGAVKTDFHYRLSRKRLTDSLTGLSTSIVRMLDEPGHARRAVEDMNLLIVQSYLLIAHVAQLRAQLQDGADEIPRDLVQSTIEQTRQLTGSTLTSARGLFEGVEGASSNDVGRNGVGAGTLHTAAIGALRGFNLICNDVNAIADRSRIIRQVLA